MVSKKKYFLSVFLNNFVIKHFILKNIYIFKKHVFDQLSSPIGYQTHYLYSMQHNNARKILHAMSLGEYVVQKPKRN